LSDGFDGAREIRGSKGSAREKTARDRENVQLPGSGRILSDNNRVAAHRNQLSMLILAGSIAATTERALKPAIGREHPDLTRCRVHNDDPPTR
jgi:hypothetical protein